MSAQYVFTDPETNKNRYFFGYLFNCTRSEFSACPYSMKINDSSYCSHPNSREYDCETYNRQPRPSERRSN